MDALKNELRTTYVALNATFREYLESQGFDKAIIDHYVQCFSANVGTGKLHRGLATLYIGKQLAKTEVNEEQSNQLCVLAWLVEMLGAHYLILDDIMDESTTRRGEPCWYRQPHIGLMAINDACILKSAIFFFLKKFLRQHPAYIDIVELFVDLGLHKYIGANHARFGILAARNTEELGTDSYIQDKKCSWLIIEALSRANEEQRSRLLQNYGRKEPSHVDIVKKVFEELDLPKAFREYEEKQRVKIEGIIAAMDESEGLKREIFLMLFQGFRKGRQF